MGYGHTTSLPSCRELLKYPAVPSPQGSLWLREYVPARGAPPNYTLAGYGIH